MPAMFAPVRDCSFKRLVYAVVGRPSERDRTRANARPCHSCHAQAGPYLGLPRLRVALAERGKEPAAESRDGLLTRRRSTEFNTNLRLLRRLLPVGITALILGSGATAFGGVWPNAPNSCELLTAAAARALQPTATFRQTGYTGDSSTCE
jgi:hypothetical protein